MSKFLTDILNDEPGAKIKEPVSKLDAQPPTRPTARTPNRPTSQPPTDTDAHKPSPPDSQYTGRPVISEPEGEIERTAGLPNLDSQESSELDQAYGRLDAQTTAEDEAKYPSRFMRRKKTVRLPIHKLEKYEAYCFFNKMDFQDVVEKAMDALTSGRLDAHILNEDLDNKKIDDVLIYYRKVTGNRVTQKDEDARAESRRFSAEVCKIGILTSVLRAPNKINSFRYCLGAIEEVAASPLQSTADYMKYLEGTLQRQKAKKADS